MWATILAALPFLQQIINFFSGIKQKQTDQEKRVNDAQLSHSSDGAISVDDSHSSASQNAALDKAEKNLDNPRPVNPTPDGEKKS